MAELIDGVDFLGTKTILDQRGLMSIKNSVKRASLLILVKLKRFLGRAWIDRIPGVNGALKFLKRRLIPAGLVQVDYHGSRVFVDIRDEVVAPSLLANAPEGYELEVFKGLVKPGMVVVDIGANIGIYSIAAARLAGENGRVYAFEPEVDNYRILLRNIEANGLSNVVPINKAIANQGSVQRLYVSKYNLAGHSLDRENVQDPAGYQDIETTTLDDFYINELRGLKVDLLKSDAQGAEGMILDGGQRFLRENEFSAIVECWPFGLRRLGYNVEYLLSVFEKYGITFKVLDGAARRRTRMDPREIVEMCQCQESIEYHFSFLLKCKGNGKVRDPLSVE